MLVYIFGTFYFIFFMLHLYVADVHNIYNILISKSFKLIKMFLYLNVDEISYFINVKCTKQIK